MKKISKNWNLLFLAILILVGVCGHYFTSRRNMYISEHGVWTVYRLGQIGYTSKGGKDAYAYYYFNGMEYKDGTGISDDQREAVRYFMALMPEKPTKVTYTGERVPSWFTLDAPPEGWPTKPTEDDLREMMVQDSLKRRLKPMTGITESESDGKVEE